jgi:UDP-N-acetylmuramyl pentapeptide phosphotransferase/UDP-N-acetylglucosamine-1-phosphate transferase
MLEACDLVRVSEAVLMSNLINWFVEGIDGVLVIVVSATLILLALSSLFGPAKVRWWFTCGDRWRW